MFLSFKETFISYNNEFVQEIFAILLRLSSILHYFCAVRLLKRVCFCSVLFTTVGIRDVAARAQYSG